MIRGAGISHSDADSPPSSAVGTVTGSSSPVDGTLSALPPVAIHTLSNSFWIWQVEVAQLALRACHRGGGPAGAETAAVRAVQGKGSQLSSPPPRPWTGTRDQRTTERVVEESPYSGTGGGCGWGPSRSGLPFFPPPAPFLYGQQGEPSFSLLSLAQQPVST